MSTAIFRILDDKVGTSLEIRTVRISTGALSLPVVEIDALKFDDIDLSQEYRYQLKYRTLTLEGFICFEEQEIPTAGSEYKIKGYLVPRTLAKDHNNRFFYSKGEAIATICSGLHVPSTLPYDQGNFYNQQGELNYAYALKLGMMISPNVLPGFSLLGYELLDFNSKDMKFSTNDLGSLMQTDATLNYKDFNTSSEAIDTFDVKTRSGQVYGTIGNLYHREIVSKDNFNDYESYSINTNLAAQLNRSVSITISDLCQGSIGDIISHYVNGENGLWMIVNATYLIAEGICRTKYTLCKIRQDLTSE